MGFARTGGRGCDGGRWSLCGTVHGDPWPQSGALCPLLRQVPTFLPFFPPADKAFEKGGFFFLTKNTKQN